MHLFSLLTVCLLGECFWLGVLFDETNLEFLRDSFDSSDCFWNPHLCLSFLCSHNSFIHPLLVLSSFFDIVNLFWLVCHEAYCGLCLRDLWFGF